MCHCLPSTVFGSLRPLYPTTLVFLFVFGLQWINHHSTFFSAFFNILDLLWSNNRCPILLPHWCCCPSVYLINLKTRVHCHYYKQIQAKWSLLKIWLRILKKHELRFQLVWVFCQVFKKHCCSWMISRLLWEFVHIAIHFCHPNWVHCVDWWRRPWIL